MQPLSDSDNICKFSNDDQSNGELFASRFIYETAPQKLGDTITYYSYACHLVTFGSAVLENSFGKFPLNVGDIFFVYPGQQFALHHEPPFKYLYISFLGSSANGLLDSIGVRRDSPVIHGFNDLIDTWFFALSNCTSENLSMLAKGVLYITFAMAPDTLTSKTEVEDALRHDIAEKMHSHIERCYANEDLSLEYLSGIYQYSSKYLSRKFTAAYGVSFSASLEACRVRHACVMLTDSHKTIKEISAAIGYHDPLYFSKVFKKIMLVTPSEYRARHKKSSSKI